MTEILSSLSVFFFGQYAVCACKKFDCTDKTALQMTWLVSRNSVPT